MRPVGSIDNQGNLRALVIQDLKELGIKVPKAKKQKRLSGAKPISVQDTQKSQRNGIFSNYLSHQTCAFVDGCGYVPEFLVHAAEFIESHTALEGLFRKSGAISRQKELKQQIEDGGGFVGANVYDVTGLIKQFFRELPEPLFTSLYHDTFIKCYQLNSEETATKSVLLLCLLLPKEHISTLRFTMMLLAKIAASCDKNKMDASNLAVVLAPNIMNINSKSEKMNSCEEKLLQHQTSIVELLINNSIEIGMVSGSLIERTDMMTEYFGTDDELLESSDVTHERKKKEKRKRSSSFHGIVIRVRQSVSKWRRSTEYKNQDMTTSSAGSNESIHSKSELIDITEATPVVIRKRKALNETVAFSASKKKAILQTLPQNVLLSNTPFTPAAGISHRHHNADPDRTGNRKSRVESPEYGDGSLCTSTTPSDCSRNHKKRLALFTSPGSSRKSRRQSPSPKKSGRAKSFLRRLSGGRTEKLSDSQSDVSTSQVGQRLASFNGSSTSEDNSCCEHKKRGSFRKHKRRHDSKAETSSVSEIYLSPSSSKQPSPSKSLQDLQHESTDNLIPRQCVSDTAIQSNQRSFSADEALDAKMNAIRRGQPNTIANGLLHGKQAEAPRVLVKRSKSINKADIGLPIPVVVPSEGDTPVQDRQSRSRHRHLQSENKSSKKPPASMNDTLMRVVLPPPTEFADRSMLPNNTPDSDHESEAGFSTISGGTVIFVPDRPSSVARDKDGRSLNQGSNASSGSSISSVTSAHDLECKRIAAASAKIRTNDSAKSLQPSSSADSLLSMRSEGSPEHSNHELSRSQSTDSGKGSMLDETLADSNASKMLNTAFIDLDKNPDTLDISMNVSSFNALVDISITTHATKKSVSSDDLQKHNPASICRSRSLYEPLSFRHGNITPNLQISTKTQKILERAGFVKEEKTLLDVSDVHVPPPVVSPSVRPSPIPEHPNEESKYIRESILDLQLKNTGKVAENIKNLGNRKSAMEADHFASPFRFPQSTTRKRGCSPIRIPTIFIKSDKEAAVKYREIAQLALKHGNIPKGTAKLPISTQLLKPTEHATQPAIETPKMIATALKRKPSIYYSREKNPMNSLRGKSHESMDSSLVTISSVSTSCGESCDDITLSSIDRTHNDNSGDDVFDDKCSTDVNRSLAPFLESSRRPDASHGQVSAALNQDCLASELSSNQSIFGNDFDGTTIPINESLKETIYDVCTPFSEKLLRKKEDLQTSSDNNPHKENNICKSDLPLQPFTPIIKQPLIRTPHSSRSVLRTANGMTPRDVLKFSRTPQNRLRSPGKPVKRPGAAKSPGQSPLKFSKSPSRVRSEVKNNLHAAMLDDGDAL